MEVKKFVFCFLFFIHVINSAEENNSDNKKFSISTVEEDSSINKNNWNTKKWGSIFFSIPHLSVSNSWFKFEQISIFGKLENKWGILFNFLLSGVIEYKYMFHKKWCINIRLNLNNLERIGFLTKTFHIRYTSGEYNDGPHFSTCPMYSKLKLEENALLEEEDPVWSNIETGYTCFSLEFSFEKIWGKKIVHTNEGIIEMIYSSSFSPIGFAFHVISFDAIKDIKFTEKVIFTGTIILLKIEFSKVSFLNFGKIKFNWHTLPYLCKDVNDDRFYNLRNFFIDLLFNFFSLEFGINIINNKKNQKKLNDEIEN